MKLRRKPSPKEMEERMDTLIETMVRGTFIIMCIFVSLSLGGMYLW